jgi:endonuclease YncB( thermonuclease family)
MIFLVALQIAATAFPCTVASVHDGDTFTCAERDVTGRSIRVRLAGVDARELGDYCARGHPCAVASADAATQGLRRLAGGQRLICHPNGMSYRRVAAFCALPDGSDLSCRMVANRYVAIWPRYWGRHRCR